jgi:hypothetical protein
MEIIYQGKHNTHETLSGLAEVLALLNKRYNISDFREIHLSVTLVNAAGEDVELVDNQTNQVFRYFELQDSLKECQAKVSENKPGLRLVVDNTKQ